MGVAVLPENLVSGFLGECLQSGGIRVGQHCIFVGSAFRAVSYTHLVPTEGQTDDYGLDGPYYGCRKGYVLQTPVPDSSTASREWLQ